MRTLPAIWLLLIGVTSQAQQSVPQIVARERDARTWAWESETVLPGGKKVRQPHRFVELGTGLCRWDADRNQWVDAAEVLDLVPGAAVGRSAQVQARFDQNLNTLGAITLSLSLPGGDGGQQLEFQSHVLGIALTDVASGRSALIAEIQDCAGEVLPPNQVIYRNAIAGNGLQCDVLLEYRLAGVSQSVVIRRPPSVTPADLGMDEGTCVLEIWNEILTPVNPRRLPQGPVALLQSDHDPAAASIPLPDEEIDFGSTRMIAGRAFSVGSRAATDPFADDALRVSKTLVVTPDTGRQFLIEAVPWLPLRDRLAAELPEAKADPAMQRAAVHAQRQFPRAPLQAKADLPPKPMQMASRPMERGYVIDWEQVLSGTGWVFHGDSTHYVAAIIYLTNAVIEGGSIVKGATNGTSYVRLRGKVDCQTSPWRPAVFTSAHDDSIGESIPGSSSNPYTSWRAVAHLYVDTTNTAELHDLRFLFSDNAILAATNVVMTNIQVSHCLRGLRQYYQGFDVKNLLVADCTYAIYSWASSTCSIEHATFHRIPYLLASGSHTVRLTNSLLVEVTNYLNYSGESNVVVSSGSGVFQTVGGGERYLADNSPYRDIGTTNLSSGMRTALKNLTTYPPLVLTNPITTDTVLSPQAGRDTDLPDLGAHYYPIDFAVHNVTVTNATLRLTNGVAVATFGDAGFWLRNGARVLSVGSALQPNVLARYYAVQERSTNWGGAAVSSGITFNPALAGSPEPEIRLRWTLSTIPAHGGYHVYSDGLAASTKWPLAELELQHSTMAGGWAYLRDAATTTYGLTNVLWDRGDLGVYGHADFHVRNNLWRGLSGLDIPETNTTSTFMDTLLDNCNDFLNLDATLTHSNNAFYVSTNFYATYGTNATELVLSSLAYEIGPLGRYYQPTNSLLINAGSRTADLAELYHFVTTTNQVRELNSTVDIGPHFVAVTNIAGVWQPIDTDGDGVPDYIEDTNGDGVWNNGESDWQSYDSRNGLSGSPGLRVYTPLK